MKKGGSEMIGRKHIEKVFVIPDVTQTTLIRFSPFRPLVSEDYDLDSNFDIWEAEYPVIGWHVVMQQYECDDGSLEEVEPIMPTAIVINDRSDDEFDVLRLANGNFVVPDDEIYLLDIESVREEARKRIISKMGHEKESNGKGEG